MERQRPRRHGTSTFHLSWQMSLCGVYSCRRVGVVRLAFFKAPGEQALNLLYAHSAPSSCCTVRGLASAQIISVLFCMVQLKLNNMATCPRDLNCSWTASSFSLRPPPCLQILACVVLLEYSLRMKDSGETLA